MTRYKVLENLQTLLSTCLKKDSTYVFLNSSVVGGSVRVVVFRALPSLRVIKSFTLSLTYHQYSSFTCVLYSSYFPNTDPPGLVLSLVTLIIEHIYWRFKARRVENKEVVKDSLALKDDERK